MKKRRAFPFLLLIAVVFGVSLYLKTCGRKKEAPEPARVDDIFSAWSLPDTPGAAVAVIKDGSIIYRQGYGMADLENAVPITPGTVFHAASVSKPFTAFAVLLLAEQGRLSLNDDIRTHLPDMPDFGRPITIRHLLHHTSGLRDQLELLAMAGYRLDDVISQEHILNMIRHQKALNFVPGSEYMYCNTGYTLLAEIVAGVTGQSFREWTRENIFAPLGMESTQFNDDCERIVAHRADSYSPAETGGYEKQVLSYSNFGATGLLTTVEDVAQWVLNLEGGKTGGKKTVERMLEQGMLNDGRKIDYACGLDVGEYRGLKIIEHDGYDAGFRSVFSWFPEQRFGVVMLSNNAAVEPAKTAHRIADIYLSREFTGDAPPPSPPERKKVDVDPVFLDRFAGRYLLENERIIFLTRDGSRLLFQGSGPDKIELLAQSDTRFVLAGTDIELSFQLNNVGMVQGLTLHQGDRDLGGGRIEVTPLSMEQSLSYAGSYMSGELGAVYFVGFEGGRIVLRHRRMGDIGLTHLTDDVFRGDVWWLRSLRFIKDEENRVVGFSLTGERVRNLRFDKVRPVEPALQAEALKPGG